VLNTLPAEVCPTDEATRTKFGLSNASNANILDHKDLMRRICKPCSQLTEAGTTGRSCRDLLLRPDRQSKELFRLIFLHDVNFLWATCFSSKPLSSDFSGPVQVELEPKGAQDLQLGMVIAGLQCNGAEAIVCLLSQN